MSGAPRGGGSSPILLLAGGSCCCFAAEFCCAASVLPDDTCADPASVTASIAAGRTNKGIDWLTCHRPKRAKRRRRAIVYLLDPPTRRLGLPHWVPRCLPFGCRELAAACSTSHSSR